jgi:Flp pilus assembly protein TadG
VKSNIPLRKREKGQSFVELALILPVMFILMAGVLDLGRFFLSYMELRDAAQEGANYASIYNGVSSDFETELNTRVKASAQFPMNLSDINVSVSPSNHSYLCTGSLVTVTVSYDFPITTPLIGVFFKNQILPMSTNMTSVVLEPGC